jgi:hypothetical protein
MPAHSTEECFRLRSIAGRNPAGGTEGELWGLDALLGQSREIKSNAASFTSFELLVDYDSAKVEA